MKASFKIIQTVTALTHFAGVAESATHRSIGDEANNLKVHSYDMNTREIFEQSWAQIPPKCKDRSFPFQPQQIATELANPVLTKLYASI